MGRDKVDRIWENSGKGEGQEVEEGRFGRKKGE